MTAAEMAQLLFSTLHTTGASSTVDRIIAAQAPARPVMTVLPSLSYRVRQ